MRFRVLVVFNLLFHICRPDFISAISDALIEGYQWLKCPLGDCCNERWIPNNIEKLDKLLHEEVFGQHIATNIVLKQIKAHLTSRVPSKPLVMSFHGWTGNGKNHVTYLIAKSLFKNGLRSRHYHHFMATVHFPHKEHATVYQDHVRKWVKGNVTNCPHSLFVFDEVDKMPEGVLDGIRAYLDYIDSVDSVDYRRAIFIFLSNTGGREITNKLHEIWLAGRVKRDELSIRDFERLIELGAFNEKGGGLHQSHLIEKSLIDVFVPFLPMEKHHVRLCAEKEFRKQRYVPRNREAALQSIVDGLNYYPEDKELYSTTGCKRVAQKVGLYIANEQYNYEMHQSNDEKNEL